MRTEADVKAAEDEVLQTPVDPEFEQGWAAETIKEFRKTEQRLKAEWRMWKFVRDDARMEAAKKDLERVRGCILYLETLLGTRSEGITG